MRIVTLGDILLDVVVQLGEPLAVGSDVRAVTRTGAGGQAANVAAWAVSLGADATVVAALGDDAAAGLVRNELVCRHTPVYAPVYTGATGVVVSMVDPDGERSMASDPGVSALLSPDDLEREWFDGCDVLHISGYALLRSPIQDAALLAASFARAAGARVSVDLSAWTEIRTYGPVRFRELLDTLAPDVLFATEAEWEILGGSSLAAVTPLAVLKRGARGCSIMSAEARLDLAPLPAEVVDATGAGDALAAGFLLGGSLEEAGRRGLEAAARCVSQLGAMP
jgi:sugar/nucleoside kinase (ribokinase family)